MSIFFIFFLFEINYSQGFSKEKLFRIDSLIAELDISHPDTTMVKINLALASEFYLSNTDSALYYSLAARDISLEKNLHDEVLSSYNWMGYCYWQQGQLQEALNSYKSALEEVNEEDHDDMAVLLNNVGYVYKDLGDLQNGLKYLKEGLKINELTHDSSGTGNSLNNIGLIYKSLEEYDKALVYLEGSYQIKLQANLEFETSAVLNNIAIIWSTKGNLDTAKYYLFKGLAISQENNDHHQTAMIFDNLGVNHRKRGNIDSAEIYFNKSIALAHQIEGKFWESSALLHHGEVMLLKGRKKEAKTSMLKAYNLASETGYPERLRDISEQLYEIYLDENDWENALKFQTEFISMRDSIINLDNKSQLIKYDFEKKTLADSLVNIKAQNFLNTKIEKQNALTKSLKKEQEQNFIWTIVAGVILFLIVFSLLRINAIRKKSNTALSDKNDQISKTSSELQSALEERNTLLKEIHHRVKNNLQTVSSLLSLQSRYLDDPNASKVLEESRNRLNSISLLHQKLYQNDNLPVVVLSDYVEELTSQIMETCQPEDKNILLDLHCVELKCDIEQAMPIGLIINELMTNAYKYAFNNRQEGVIRVKLSHSNEDNYMLVVSDDGDGFPDGFTLKGGNSMGLNLVTLLTRQMKGTITTENNNGAQFLINFVMKNKH